MLETATSYPRFLQNANWRWTYRVMLIWIFVEMVCLFLVRSLSSLVSGLDTHPFLQFVPETYVPVNLKKKAKRYQLFCFGGILCN